MATENHWRRNIFTGTYSNGIETFFLRPRGRAGDIIFADGLHKYKIPYEYGTDGDLLAIWPELIKRVDDEFAGISLEKRQAICRSIRTAIEDVHKKGVGWF
jgi:hypothetical protein